MDERIEEVLRFWFEEPEADEERPTGVALWFQKSAATDRLIEKRFGRLLERANAGELDGWASTPRGRLALIIVLDQFNRNVHRDTARAYVGDSAALALCFDGLDDEVDKELGTCERAFFYIPCMHAEDTDAQFASVEVFEELRAQAPPAHHATCESFLKYAHEHRDIVERFERFPHRNNILGRPSTSEESAFLQHSGHF